MIQYLLLLANYSLLLILPGYLLARLLVPESRSIFERVPLYFSLSLVLLVVPALAGYLFGLNPGIVLGLFALITLCLILLNLLFGGVRNSGSAPVSGAVPGERRENSWKENLYSLVPGDRTSSARDCGKKIAASANRDAQGTSSKFLVIITLAVALTFTGLILFFGAVLDGDAMGYVSFVQKMVSQGKLTNTGAFYKEVQVDPTHSYNIWLLSLACLSFMTKINPVDMWVMLPAMLTPIMICALFAFTVTLFRNREVGLIAVIVFLLFHGVNQGMWIFRTAPFVMVISNFIVLPIALSCALMYFRESKGRYLLVSIFLGVCLATIHPMGAGIFFISLCSFLGFQFFLQREEALYRRRIITLILLTLLFCLPYIALKLPYVEVVNEFYLKAKPPIWIAKHLAYMPPNHLFAPHYHVQHPYDTRYFYVFAYFLVPVVVSYLKRKDWALFLFANMLTPPLIMLNPLLVPILGKMILFEGVSRISQLSPAVPLVGFFMYSWVGSCRLIPHNFLSGFGRKNQAMQVHTFDVEVSRKKGICKENRTLHPLRGRNAFCFRGVAIIILILVVSVIPGFNHGLTGLFNDKNPRFHPVFANTQECVEVAGFIDEEAGETSVILSDWQLSFFLAAFTKHYVAMTHPGHASPSAGNQKQREEDARKVFCLKDNIEETMSILRKYEVGYIVVRPKSSDLWGDDVELSKFTEQREFFEKLYEKDNVYVFRVREA